MKYILMCLVCLILNFSCDQEPEQTVIVLAPDASSTEELAAKEVRRYIYQRTGVLSDIVHAAEKPEDRTAIIIAAEGSPFCVEQDFAPQSYSISTTIDNYLTTTICGDTIGVLYGAFAYAESLGVRFYLYGDIFPEELLVHLPEVNCSGSPLFRLRGIHPFHDFPEGPDWWDVDNYKAVLAQLPKLKMNFFALHTYPEDQPFEGVPKGPEPTVWIGLEHDVLENGNVRFSPQSRHFTTHTGSWGYQPMNTANYHFGLSQIYERNDFGARYMKGRTPWPETPRARNQLFNDFGDLLGDAFTFAHQLGIQTCVGTESPLTIPEVVKQRILQQGGNPSDEESIQRVYRGMFQWIIQNYPLDYYWLWTPEDWTWHGATDAEVRNTQRDLQLAYSAMQQVNASFEMATCGWVLGPPQDRTLFDKVLPKDVAFSCINRQLGKTPVDSNFADIKNRPKWAIPWLEDDPRMISPQLWVGRMRQDAVHALSYGCTGLMGIHWRTKSVGPMVAALANAAWDQSWKDQKVETNEDSLSERYMPTRDFYRDWAEHQFGPNVADEAAGIFIKIDGRLHEPSQWVHGPGAILVNPQPWDSVRQNYNFVDELEDLALKVKGQAYKQRFNDWLNTFKYMRASARVGCLLGELEQIITEIDTFAQTGDKKTLAKEKALPVRLELALEWSEMITFLIPTLVTRGDMGTITNLEQHNLGTLNLLNKHDEQLIKWLGEELPPEAELSTKYQGELHIIVPTTRSLLQNDEPLRLWVRILSEFQLELPVLHWRILGEKTFNEKPFKLVDRNVYKIELSAELFQQQDIEYFVTVSNEAGESKTYPVTAPDLNETVVVMNE